MSFCPDCISVDGGCCCDVFTEDWKIILLPSEVTRLSVFTGWPLSKFVNDDPLSDSQREAYTTGGALADPLWAELMSFWPRPTGIKDHCPFLNRNGCILPYHAKPFICQAFPLDFNVTHNSIALPEESRCAVVHHSNSVDDILKYFSDDRAAFERAFADYRQDFLSLIQLCRIVRGTVRTA